MIPPSLHLTHVSPGLGLKYEAVKKGGGNRRLGALHTQIRKKGNIAFLSSVVLISIRGIGEENFIAFRSSFFSCGVTNRIEMGNLGKSFAE